jgi:hypothetical protein
MNWKAANAEFFGYLTAWKPRVLFLFDVPDRRASVPGMVSGNPSNIRAGCTQPRSEVVHHWWTAHAAAIRETAQTYGAWVIDTLDLSCGPTLCPCVVDDILIMWDSNHMTVEYVGYIAPIVVEEMRLGFLQPLWNASK